MAPRTPEEKARLSAKIREHRLSGIEWQQSCVTLGISRATYFRYYDALSQEELAEELLQNHRRFIHQFYANKKRLIQVTWKKAETTEDPRFYALVNSVENDLFDRLMESGLLPTNGLPTVERCARCEEHDNLMAEALIQINKENARKKGDSERMIDDLERRMRAGFAKKSH